MRICIGNLVGVGDLRLRGLRPANPLISQVNVLKDMAANRGQ